MQYAEGPKAFEIGFRKMLEDFGTDLVRTRYINSLYNDDRKTHFKRNLQFSNAVLVDMCEILFSAVKTWVYGQGRKSSSLIMAIVIIAEGCRRLIREPFLKDVKKTKKITVDRAEYRPVVVLFTHLIQKLTLWAC